MFPMRKSLPWLLAQLLLCSPTHATLQQQLEEDARQTLEHYAANQGWQDVEAEYRIWLAPAGTELPPCQQPPELIPGGQHREPFGRRPYLIRCPLPAWELRGRVDVSVWLTVWSAARNIERGHQIGAADVMGKQVEVSRIHRSIIPHSRDLLGATTTRRLRAGQLIGDHDLQVKLVVNKGDEVLIRAGTGGLSASMRGEALQGGQRGDAIRVRNLSSGKEIQTWISGPGEVETRF